MSYETDLNRAGSASRRREVGLATSANSSGRDGASPHYRFYELEPAYVVDINLTDKDSTKIGNAIVRPIFSYATVPDAQLPSARPLDSNTKNYPLKGEVVIVVEYQGQLFYSQRLNFFNLTNQNIVRNPLPAPNDNPNNNYNSVAFGNPNVTPSSAQPNVNGGVYFTPNKSVKSLLPLEGDIIYEGRFGQSIRFSGTVPQGTSGVDKRFSGTWVFGTGQGSPILILRNGQRDGLSANDNAPYVEDINKDPSSIYLTSDQKIPFIPSSKNQKTYAGAAPSVYDGKQVLIASDRIIFNARKNEILLFAAKSIGLSTEGTLNFDSTKETLFNASKISLGLNATEHLLLGDKMKAWLEDMITAVNDLVDAINAISVLTGTGPSSTVQSSPGGHVAKLVKVTQELTTLKNKTTTLLSKQNFTL